MAEETDFKLDESVTDRDLLFRIARELTTIRQQNQEMLRHTREAEAEVPEALWRFANYLHDVHDIKYMHEEHGAQPPDYILREIERLDDRYRQILRTLNTEGGAIEKIRREMASDSENRYDHTRLLPVKGA